MSSRRLRSGVVLASCVGLALGPATVAGAVPTDSVPAFSLTVSPTRLVIGPSQLGALQRFEVFNRGRDPIDVVVQKANFVPNDNGTLRFQPLAPYSASNWVRASPARLRLAAGDKGVVQVRVEVPAKPEPGEHQMALIFQVPAAAGGANIKLNRSIGTPVYVTVPGPSDDTVVVTDLRAKGISWRGPIDLGVTVRDIGTMHRDFHGTARLPVTVGGQQVLFPDFTVLRGATRQVETRWQNPPLLCRCTATVAITGTNGSVTTRAVEVTVISVYLIAGVAAALLLLLVLLLVAVRRRRRSTLAGSAA